MLSTYLLITLYSSEPIIFFLLNILQMLYSKNSGSFFELNIFIVHKLVVDIWFFISVVNIIFRRFFLILSII